MASIILKNVKKIYGDVEVIQNLNLEIKDGSFTVLVGPSGCGKSTTLRMLAGLEELTEGELWIDGELMNHVPPGKRDIAMVFQNYALYPSMTVKQNIEFGLKNRKTPKQERERLIEEISEIVGLQDYLHRKPSSLSGGQRQRVALARAMVKKPKVFLMDEPLSNLDAKLRVQMRAELIELHKRLGTTFVYVTHDQIEAMSMGTEIVIMNKGKIQQVDEPMAIYHDPENVFAAQFIGTPPMNIVKASSTESSMKNKAIEYIGFRSEKVVLATHEYERHDGLFFTGTVIAKETLGAETNYQIQTKAGNIIAKSTNHTLDDGTHLLVYIPKHDLYYFNKDGDRIRTISNNNTKSARYGGVHV